MVAWKLSFDVAKYVWEYGFSYCCELDAQYQYDVHEIEQEVTLVLD